MQTEFEVKILEIDPHSIAQKLDSMGAIYKGEKFQRRFVYDLVPPKENTWIRLRCDGSKTTLALKEIHHEGIDGTQELEIVVDNFEKTRLLIEKMGHTMRGYQENKRMSYILDDVNIEIDSWPLIPTYLEIEGKNVTDVENAVKKLGFPMSQTTSINTTLVYQHYGIDLASLKDLRFEDSK